MKRACLLLAGLLLLTGCNPQRFFYYPNRNMYADPDLSSISYEIAVYPNLNGKRLYGLFFKTIGKPKGRSFIFMGTSEICRIIFL